MSGSGGPSPAEQHLGDRLAALVDGELKHDARERVLAHLATCGKCKAEADAQRRLKSVFAQTAPPGPSEGLLARLQQLPGGDPGGPGSFGRGDFARDGGAFSYVASRNHSGHALAGIAPQPRSRGFRVHEAERPGQRRRFAFAAAGAVSLAAIALGGALPLEASADLPGGRADGNGTTVTPLSVSPAADSNVLLRGDAFPAGRSGAGARQPSGGPTLAPAPGAMSLYGPGAASPSPSYSLPAAAPADRFGLSPRTAPNGPASAYGLTPLTAATGGPPARKNPPPLPPLEPMRPLIGPAAPAGPSAHGSTPAQR
ncbi:zf-HC2 domain-containing protein [Streptomyces sp. NBC_01456]|uniref:zf-HC2 domain-containing protein n=1 Tax=unclassified Streptomyces TaxID=2593676 RepID=UPI002E322DA1|nr:MULTISPECIES: zf-HC2 domain-containing protein [unclassified Streptomyces]